MPTRSHSPFFALLYADNRIYSFVSTRYDFQNSLTKGLEMSVSDQLRDEISRTGKTNYRIGTDLGISISTVDRFVNGRKPASTDTFDTLCEYFGLELAKKKPETTLKQAKRKTTTRRRKKSGE